MIRQQNHGKAAPAAGVAAARNELIVFIDADTHCQRQTLLRLLAPFIDPSIGGVSGHAKVGNLRSFIARCQSLEYIVGFNLDRRAYTRWNCITVLPGAISAIRKQAIDRAGGLSLDTLAEDTDLTLSLHKQRLRSVYIPGSRSVDGGAGNGANPFASTIPLGLWHSAMFVETSRHGL